MNRCVLILFIGNFDRRVKIVFLDFSSGKGVTSTFEVYDFFVPCNVEQFHESWNKNIIVKVLMLVVNLQQQSKCEERRIVNDWIGKGEAKRICEQKKKWLMMYLLLLNYHCACPSVYNRSFWMVVDIFI